MFELLPTLLGGLFCALLTEKSTYGNYRIQKRQPLANRIAFAMLVAFLAYPIALRTAYNDTFNYMRGFAKAKNLSELLGSGSLHLLKNPAFQIYESLIRTFTDNSSIYFLFPAVFVQYSYARFIRRHCPSFFVGMILYFCLGTYTFSMAAMKQVIAMAILLYAVDDLIDRKNKQFYLKVFLAFLFHTYAIVVLILAFFTNKPWTMRTFALLGAVLFVIFNFETVILSFLEIANESGKSVDGSELLGTASINPIRVAVYAVGPLFALVFRRRLFSRQEDREHNILINMSIICVSIMSVGLVSAANMCARLAQYFEFGMICSLPWMVKKPFDKASAKFVTFMMIVCFTGFFLYANLLWTPFDDNFSRLTLMEFVKALMDGMMFG